MGFLKRILRKGGESDHEAWLKAHPGKESMHMTSAAVTDEEKARMRSQMEGELDTQRGNRQA